MLQSTPQQTRHPFSFSDFNFHPFTACSHTALGEIQCKKNTNKAQTLGIKCETNIKGTKNHKQASEQANNTTTMHIATITETRIYI